MGGNLVKLVIFLLGIFTFVQPIEFNRHYTGVKFTPYVKRAEEGPVIPSMSSYTFGDLKTMLEVISTKFSRVATASVDAKNFTYVERKTYYYDSGITARTAEAAALINRQRNNKSLTVLIGIQNDNGVDTETETKVALEAAEIARSIYPGTVEGFVFSRYTLHSLEWAKSTFYWIRKFRQMTRGRGYKIGITQSCHDFKYNDMENIDERSESGKILKLRRDMIMWSDFIICSFAPADRVAQHGAKYSFNELFPEILQYREKIHEVNRVIEVYGETFWPSMGNETWHSIDNLKDYWTSFDKFASEHNFTMWMESAFDSPRQIIYDESKQHLGWWKLSRNDLIQDVSGYIAKVSEKPVEIPQITENIPTEDSLPDLEVDGKLNNDILMYVAAIAGIFAIFMVMFAGVLCYFFSKRRNPQTQRFLTPQDVHEFKYGLLEDSATEQNYDAYVNSSALKQPYDKTLEIPKGKLEILKDQILGGGQFGCVYKAIIRMGKVQEVAVKMPKPNCPPTALKGLLSEIKILAYLGSHPNIVSICGAYTAELKNGIVYMATELCPLGSLKTNLRKCKKALTAAGRVTWNKYANTVTTYEGIPFADMIRWSYEIACGMEFLGEKNVVHSDLATRNVLLSSDGTAKISDFGLSRRLYDYTVYTKQHPEPLPWRWMAIESLKMNEFSVKSDVWGYGVTLWEIFSLGDQPFSLIPWSLDFIESLENGLTLKQPPYATNELYQIMRDCWNFQPEERPTFSHLKDITNGIYLNLNNTRKDKSLGTLK